MSDGITIHKRKKSFRDWFTFEAYKPDFKFLENKYGKYSKKEIISEITEFFSAELVDEILKTFKIKENYEELEKLNTRKLISISHYGFRYIKFMCNLWGKRD